MEMKRFGGWWTSSLFVFTLGIFFVPDEAGAIPAFARQVGVPCTVCHVQFPKLNDFGMAFKQNGYRLKGKEGDFVWQKNSLPLAAMTVLMYENRDQTMGTASEKESAVSRESLEFFSAGSVGPAVSYFFDYKFVQSQITDSPSGDTVTVNEAEPGGTFLIFNDLAPDNLLNLRIGVMSNEFFYLSAPRQTTLTDYLAPVSPDFVGLELNGVHPAGIRYAAGYGNDEVDVGTVDNNLRGYFGWAAYTLLGQTLGVRYNAAKAGSAGTEETHTQLDGNLDLHYGPANVILGYFTQDKVDGVSGAKQDNLLAELIYIVGPKVLVTGRYETQNMKTVSGTDKQTVLNVSYFMLPNMKLVAEYSKLKGDEVLDWDADVATPDSTIDQDIFKIAFQMGF